MTINMTVRLVTVKDAAARLGLNPSSVTAALRDGRLEGQKAGPVWLVDEASLLRYRPRWHPRRGPQPQ